MSNWKTFESTVSPESWKRINAYAEDAEEHCELSDYPSISSWYEMVSVLSMHENGLAIDSKYNDLIKDYKLYWAALGK